MNTRVYYLLILLSAIVNVPAYAQRTDGLTHRPDTSFTNYSAYTNAKKNYPQTSWVKEDELPSVKKESNIPYLTIDNTTLSLDVFHPKKKHKPLPAILIIHGGGWRSGNRMQHYALAERLAEKGYVCFTVSYRLSTDVLFPGGVQDLKSAIRWIRANARPYGVDTSRVVALGFSSGAQMAALIGTTNGMDKFEGPSGNLDVSSNVQAIVSIDGILAFIHPESGEGNDSKSTSAATYWFGYSKTENPALWNEASALTYAGLHTPPTLFLNSSQPRFHAGRDDYIKELSKHNIYTEVHEFEAPHTFCLFEPWFTPTVDYITAFLKKVL